MVRNKGITKYHIVQIRNNYLNNLKDIITIAQSYFFTFYFAKLLLKKVST